MDVKTIGPVKAFDEGWSLLRRNPSELLGGFALFAAILALFCMLPATGIIRWSLLAIVVFPLLGGLLTLFLKAARNDSQRLTDLFCGFSQFWKWFSTGWVYASVFNVFLVPCLLVLIAAAILVAYSLPGDEALHVVHGVRLRILAAVLAPVAALLLFAQYAFMLFAAVDADGISRSVARSQALVQGKPFRLRLTMLAIILLPYTLLVIGCAVSATGANAFGWLGWAVYAVTTILAMTVALSALTWVFVRLDDEESPSQSQLAA